jgi:acyl dehydratase
VIDYKTLVGRKGPTFVCTVEAGKIKEYAAAVDDWSDFFWSDDSAEQYASPTFSHIYRSGKMQAMNSADLSRFVQGEHDITYHRPLRPGDRIAYDIEIISVTEKEGRQSGPIALIVLQTLLRDASSGEPVQTIRQTFVGRR